MCESLDKRNKTSPAWPGHIALVLMTATTSLWTFWGIAELYYEGWGNPFPAPLAYLIPAGICMLLSFVVLTWPKIGAWILITAGGLFTTWWWVITARRAGELTFQMALSMFPVSGMIILIGLLFLFEARYRTWRKLRGDPVSPVWWRRNYQYLVAFGLPVLILLGVSAFNLPRVLTRIDDGNRGAQLIEARGIRLIWAPAGPGWNWRQPAGWNPSWKQNALYGWPPIGLRPKEKNPRQQEMDRYSICCYLNQDGTTLMEEPQNVWRMPTTDELVRSLIRDGESAGCEWNGEEGKVHCASQPDKEMPLWATDQSAIYYWSGDEKDKDEAYYVSYNGWVGSQPKTWGNPRHGHRCVKEPNPENSTRRITEHTESTENR